MILLSNLRLETAHPKKMSMNISITYVGRGIARGALSSTVCLNATLLIYRPMLSLRTTREKLDKAFIT